MTSDRDEAVQDDVVRDQQVPPQDPVHDEPEREAATEAASGAAAQEAGPGQTPPPGLQAPPVEQQLAERTADLQRLQAEYLNYKRRVDRDRELIRTNAVASVVSAMLPVLDDIGRARDHDELHGGFKAVSDSFGRALESFGLEPFGAEGDRFDPTVHEAMLHGYSTEVSEPVADKILQVGYRLGER
ncbi:MAG: nucleotide exchange factor GrpE, partial [Nocardioidaceae bacterium]